MIKKKTPILSDLNFAILIALIFFSFGLLINLNHEMWHDETHEWLIARDSTSYGQLIDTYRDNAHPMEWITMLWILNKFTSNMFYMQLLNLFFATISIFLFVRFSVFSRIFKVLFTFGYFPLYQYASIAREYSLGMLMFFIVIIFFHNRWRNFIFFSILVFFLANAGIITFLFSDLIFIFLIYEMLQSRFGAKSEFEKPKGKYSTIIGFSIIILGIFLSFYNIKLMSIISGSNISRTEFTLPSLTWMPINNLGDLIHMFSYTFNCLFSRAFLPLPRPVMQFWWTNLYDSQWFAIFLIFNLVFLVVSFMFFRKKKDAIFLWGSAIILFFVAFLIKPYDFTDRHFGFLYLYFLFCLWVFCPKEVGKNLTFFKDKIGSFLARMLIFVILIVQIAGMSIAVFFDLKYPFTRAKEVAAYINENNLGNRDIIGWTEDSMASIIAYGNIKQIYRPSIDRYTSFIIVDVDDERHKKMKFIDLFKPVITLTKPPEDFLVIITQESVNGYEDIPKLIFNIGSNMYHLKELKSFYPAIVRGESFVIYEFEKLK